MSASIGNRIVQRVWCEIEGDNVPQVLPRICRNGPTYGQLAEGIDAEVAPLRNKLRGVLALLEDPDADAFDADRLASEIREILRRNP